MLLSRYKDINYVLSLSYIDGTNLVKKAYEKVTEDKLFHRWVANYEGRISYAEFKNELIQPTTTIIKSDEEILKDVKGILDDFTIKRGEE